LVANQDFKNWEAVMGAAPSGAPSPRRVDVPRPGHADLVGKLKYGFEDIRDVIERASARERAMRVALGAVARKFLADCGVAVASRVVAIGGMEDVTALPCAVKDLNARLDADPVRCANPDASARMVARIDAAKAAGDTVGGVFEVLADGLPVGLGGYAQWDRRLEGPLTGALMSLNAIKGVEVGGGFGCAAAPGSKVHDAYEPRGKKVGYRSNRSGGLDGGMTTGQTLVLRAAMKPIATLMTPLDSVDLRTMKPAKAHIERSDACAVPAAAVIGEALVCLVLADAVLTKFGGDSMREILPRLRAWVR
ncbi:MAG: chorismate synthase, partial [Elusimicrobiota bacterium]